MKPLNASELADKIVKAICLRQEKEGKDITRFQLSNKSLALLAKREVISGLFMSQVGDEIINNGWCCFQVTSTSYCFLRSSAAKNFRRFNGETLIEILEQS